MKINYLFLSFKIFTSIYVVLGPLIISESAKGIKSKISLDPFLKQINPKLVNKPSISLVESNIKKSLSIFINPTSSSLLPKEIVLLNCLPNYFFEGSKSTKLLK